MSLFIKEYPSMIAFFCLYSGVVVVDVVVLLDIAWRWGARSELLLKNQRSDEADEYNNNKKRTQK